MEFKKFSEIEHFDNAKFLQLLKEKDLTGGEWAVTEKIHGANFALYYDGSILQAANRSTFLDEDTKFFNFQKVVSDNREKVKQLFNSIKEAMPIDTLIIYGELCGGNYSHPDVRKIKGAIQLQKGIFYCPDNIFYAFDLRVNGKYLPVSQTEQFLKKAGFLYAKTLFSGSFEECINYSNKFESTIAKELGLPDITDNVCEGIVIRPMSPKFMPNGQRVILKSKNAKWAEKSRKGKPKKKQAPVKLSEEAAKLQDEALSFINENRLNNVISKIGEVSKDDFGKVLGLFNKDIIKDFDKEYEDDFIQLEKAEQKTIRKRMNDEAAKVVRKQLT